MMQTWKPDSPLNPQRRKRHGSIALPTCTATPLILSPAFDLDRFAALSRSQPNDDMETRELAETWCRWRRHLRAYRIDCRGERGSWLLLWLEPVVERNMEDAWSASPLRGYLLDMLAASLVMAAAESMIPELASLGCAPVPEPHPAIRGVAFELGLNWTGPGALDRRYAMVTALPYAGGCESCSLCADCPRLRGAATA